MANILSVEQIAQVAVNAGLASGSQTLYTAVSIALAESGGDFDINNEGLNSDGSVDYGGWQINSVHNPPIPDIYKPSVNAKYMMDISSNGSNWSPWTTYKNGAYLTHMSKVMGELSGKTITAGPGSSFDTAAGGNGATFQQAGISDVVGETSSIVEFAKKLTEPKTWVRIIKIAAGLSFIISALLNLALASKGGKAAVNGGLMVLTKGKGKVAKAATTATVVKDVAE